MWHIILAYICDNVILGKVLEIKSEKKTTKKRASVFKCKLIPILENIFLAGQLRLMQTWAPPPEKKPLLQLGIKMLCLPKSMVSLLIGCMTLFLKKLLITIFNLG